MTNQSVSHCSNDCIQPRPFNMIHKQAIHRGQWAEMSNRITDDEANRRCIAISSRGWFFFSTEDNVRATS